MEAILRMIEEYERQLSLRYPTMKMALDLLGARRGWRIVETGTIRMAEDWGAGCSTLIFGRWAKENSGRLTTVDNSFVHMETAKLLTTGYADCIQYIVSDSVKFLSTLPHHTVDLLYLDSFDYPYGQLLDIYGGRTDINNAIRILSEMGDEEVLRLHGEIVLPCQEHCAKELGAALLALHDDSIVLIDDDNIPGGGKPRLAKELLREAGWIEVLKGQQSLWTK